MNVERICHDFNPSKFLVHSSLFVFTILFALRLDQTITWSYWVVFAPIWFWNSMVLVGSSIGSVAFYLYPHFRIENEAYVQYKAMMITLALHLLLLMFELLACDKLESDRHVWILVFVPLIFISIISIAICIWAVKNDRSFDIELFCSVNILQFVFLALKLDEFINWEWEIVFVPLWILLCVSLVGVLYSIIFAGILLRAPEINTEQRRNSTNSAISYTFLVIPILVFQVLLTNKLDGDIDIKFIGVVSPLFLTFSQLIVMSFSTKKNNKWWFGIRKSFCLFLFDICPCFEEYCNISYTTQRNNLSQRQPESSPDEASNRRLTINKITCKLTKLDCANEACSVVEFCEQIFHKRDCCGDCGHLTKRVSFVEGFGMKKHREKLVEAQRSTTVEDILTVDSKNFIKSEYKLSKGLILINLVPKTFYVLTFFLNISTTEAVILERSNNVLFICPIQKLSEKKGGAMKLVDARKIETDVPVMISWSPKADIFAIVYNNAHVSLYRINWQKVFECACLKEGIPDHIAWHPEGQYIAFIIKKVVYILEVDHGRLITKYNIHDEVVWLKWRSTKYEVLNSEKTAGDSRSKSNKQQVEKHLSLLVFGCKNGHVYIYCAGQVLLHHIKFSSLVPRLKILSGDVSEDLQYLEFVGQRIMKSEVSESTEFVFKHNRNFIMPTIVDTVGNLSFRFGSLKSAWKETVGQLNSLGDNWSKIFDVYDFYISHTPSMQIAESLAQYHELVLNRVDSVELQVFLSSAGRDKEVKKKIQTITSSSKSLQELISPIKINLTRCAYDAQTISRFMCRFSGASADKTKCRLLRKIEIVFRGLLCFLHHFHALAQTFSDDLIQFMLLITYTIHSYHSNEYITEMFNIEKVLRLLSSKVERSMFEYYLINNKMDNFDARHEKMQRMQKPEANQVKKLLASLGNGTTTSHKLSTAHEESKDDSLDFEGSASKKKKYSRSSSGSPAKAEVMKTKSDWEFLRNVFRTLGGHVNPIYGVSVEKLIEDVFKIPLVEPHGAYTSYILFDSDDLSISPTACDLWTDSETIRTRIFIQLNSRKMYLFEFNGSNNVAKMKSAELTFSRDIVSTVFFSNEYLTTVSYSPNDKKAAHMHGHTFISQLSIDSALSKRHEPETKNFTLEDNEEYHILPPSAPIAVHVPLKGDELGLPQCRIIKHVLPLENICPLQLAVSGVRKMGVFLNSECNRILLLDLDFKSAHEEGDPEVIY